MTLDGDSLDMAGFRLHQVTAAEVTGSPLQDEIDWAHVNEEVVELWEVRVPGNRPRAHLLVRPTGDCYIAWGPSIVVRGRYEVPEALRMFSRHLEGEGSFAPEEAPPLCHDAPKKRGRPKGSANRKAPPPAQGIQVALTPTEVKVLHAFLESCVGYTYHLENSLTPEELVVGDALLERFEALVKGTSK